MDYYNKILILNKYLKLYIEKEDYDNAKKLLINIKTLHGQIIEYILMLKDSKETNKLEVLSDLEVINYKIISIINQYENIDFNEKKSIKESIIDKKESIKDKNKINKNLPSLILFYAEWCGHCKKLIPIWDALKDLLPSDKLNILKISCVEKEKECHAIKEIQGYPTIIFVNIKNNNKIVYSGERTPEAIINFINECFGEEIIKITN